MYYVLALDQGTTSTRALMFRPDGSVAATARRELPQIFPGPGLVEHDPELIFRHATEVIGEAIAAAGATATDVAALGITNQRETVVVWDKRTGLPVCNAVVWQCRRTAERMRSAEILDRADYINDVTGLRCDAYFSASKIEWILRSLPGALERARRGELLAGTIDCWLLYRLTGGRVHATDFTNASRTMLFDIGKLRWDENLCALFGVPTRMLPAVLPSAADFGCTLPEFFGAPIPIRALAGDQQAALYGQGCTAAGGMKNTYGTGCFLLLDTGENRVSSASGLVTTLAAGASERPRYVLEGSAFVGGAVVKWLRDELGLIPSAESSEALARSVPDSGGVFLVPAFVGLGAPYWDPDARGIITGLTRGTTRAHIVRAALESIAFGVSDLVDVMRRDCSALIFSPKPSKMRTWGAKTASPSHCRNSENKIILNANNGLSDANSDDDRALPDEENNPRSEKIPSIGDTVRSTTITDNIKSASNEGDVQSKTLFSELKADSETSNSTVTNEHGNRSANGSPLSCKTISPSDRKIMNNAKSTANERDVQSKTLFSELKADGGAAANDFLMQFQADILGMPVMRSADVETTARGAAYLAGLTCGFFDSEIKLSSPKRFTPSMPDSQRRSLISAWHSAVSRSLSSH